MVTFSHIVLKQHEKFSKVKIHNFCGAYHICLAEKKIQFRYNIIHLQKMTLENVKITVLKYWYEGYEERTRERTFFVEKITSLADIALVVHKRFGNVDIEEVYYKGKFQPYSLLNI